MYSHHKFLKCVKLIGQSKNRPTYDIDTSDFCDNSQKGMNEDLHSFQIVPENDGKILILKREQFLEHMIRFSYRNIGTNNDAYISSSINIKM